jgi:hypothetical protein
MTTESSPAVLPRSTAQRSHHRTGLPCVGWLTSPSGAAAPRTGRSPTTPWRSPSHAAPQRAWPRRQLWPERHGMPCGGPIPTFALLIRGRIPLRTRLGPYVQTGVAKLPERH